MSEPEWVWVEDRSWWVEQVPDRLCSFPRCDGRAVAVCQRPSRRARSQNYRAWYHYCSAHLYGHRVVDGRVEARVVAGSKAARRGWTW